MTQGLGEGQEDVWTEEGGGEKVYYANFSVRGVPDKIKYLRLINLKKKNRKKVG